MSSDSLITVCNRCGTKNRIPRERLGERARCGKCHAPLSPVPDRAEEVSDFSFQEEVLDFPGTVLLEFFAPWCGYCKMLSPILDQLAAEYAGRVKVVKMNVEENPRTASQYGIRSTPALFFFRSGKILDQVLGAVPRMEIERRLRTIL